MEIIALLTIVRCMDRFTEKFAHKLALEANVVEVLLPENELEEEHIVSTWWSELLMMSKS